MTLRPRTRFLLLAILPLLLSLGLIALAMQQQQQDLSHRERQVVERAIMAAKETELLNRVNQARSALARGAAAPQVEDRHPGGHEEQAAQVERMFVAQAQQQTPLDRDPDDLVRIAAGHDAQRRGQLHRLRAAEGVVDVERGRRRAVLPHLDVEG